MTHPLQPRDDLDGFCSCPSCGLLGTHGVERTVFVTPKVPGANGELVELLNFAQPLGGTVVVRRTCVFCGHAWNRTVREAT